MGIYVDRTQRKFLRKWRTMTSLQITSTSYVFWHHLPSIPSLSILGIWRIEGLRALGIKLLREPKTLLKNELFSKSPISTEMDVPFLFSFVFWSCRHNFSFWYKLNKLKFDSSKAPDSYCVTCKKLIMITVDRHFFIDFRIFCRDTVFIRLFARGAY